MKKSLVLAIFVLVSCSPRTYYRGYSEKDLRGFENIGVFQPVISITEIGKKHRKSIYEYNNEIANHFKTIISPMLSSSNSEFIFVDSTEIQEEMLISLLEKAFKQQAIDSLKADILKRQNNSSKFFLITYLNGWYKTRSLVNWESTKSVLYAIFTLGTYIPIYYEYGITLYSAMLDLTTNQVVYKERISIFKDPKAYGTLSELVNKSITKYFKN